MRTSKRISVGKFLAMLQEVETTNSIADVCRRAGVSESTFRRWQKRLSAEIEVDRRLQDENRRLKRHVNELSVDKVILQRIIKKGP